MGLFDFFKKKSSQEQMIEKDSVTERELFRTITQEVALFMFEVGITKQPALSFFREDKGILQRLFVEHTTNPEILVLKERPDIYLLIVGMHAFGAGAYVTAKQLDFGHAVAEFTQDEINGIFLDFSFTDAYELALGKLGVSLDSRNKQVLDNIVITGKEAAKQVLGNKIMEPENIKVYMQVLFNAGVSMYMLRKVEGY